MQQLLRRSLANGKLAYYVCYTPRETALEELVRVAGMHWTIEECFEAAKGEVEIRRSLLQNQRLALLMRAG